MQERGAKIAEAGRRWRQQHRELATVGWDASPISTARLSVELWAQVKNEDWSWFRALAQTKPGDPANGKRLLMRNGCYQCHGTVGQGGLAGPRLAQTKLTLAGFTSYVRNPRPSNMPT